MSEAYDWRDDARKGYELAIAMLRWRLAIVRLIHKRGAMAESFLDGKVTLHRGDCLEVLASLPEASVDSVVCDPPYHLTSIVKRFGSEARTNMSQPADKDLSKVNAGAFRRLSKGFMGKQWDGGDIAFQPETWALVARVLKPGGHLLAFSGTRTYHRMACAIEDAGFEIRDQIGWCYGSGFPKSHDVSKGIDRHHGAEREVIGQKRYGKDDFERSPMVMQAPRGTINVTANATDDAKEWAGWGTALKPAWEPIVLARKPLSESSIAANVLKHGTGGINVDGCRVEAESNRAWRQPNGQGVALSGSVDGSLRNEIEDRSNLGRWPANLIHDGSEEVLAGFPESKSSGGIDTNGHDGEMRMGRTSGQGGNAGGLGDTGSAARFFYTAKADADDRLGSKHPTVKPLDLMQYLVRLVTPKGGVVLDPFAGTGTTGDAAWREGSLAVLIECEPEYQADIVKRMGLCLAGPDQRRAATITQISVADLPLFGRKAGG